MTRSVYWLVVGGVLGAACCLVPLLAGGEEREDPAYATYANPRFGFEFDYPRAWELIEPQDERPVVAVRSRTMEPFSAGARGRPNFHVMVGRGADLEDLEAEAKGNEGLNGVTFERRTINGHSASLFRYTKGRFQMLSAAIIRNDDHYVVLTGTAGPDCWETHGPSFERMIESFWFR